MRKQQRSAAEERERALSALRHLDAGVGREDWVLISMSAKAAGIAYSDWLAWCETGGNFGGESDCRSVWKSIDEKGGTGPGTLFELALRSGWEPPPEDARMWVSEGSRRKKPARRQAARTEYAPLPPHLAMRRDALWEAGAPADPLHPYLVRKNISEHNLRQIEIEDAVRLLGYTPENKEEPLQGTCLMVPLMDVQRNLLQIELIDSVGRKTVLAKLPRKGAFWTPDPSALDDMVLLIGVAEGTATAWTTQEVGGHPVVAAGSWGSMESVALELAAAFPGAEIVLYPDRGDQQEEKAAAIAQAVLGRSIPLPSKCPRGWDYNDFVDAEGIDAARDWVRPKLTAPGFRVNFNVALGRGRIEIDELLPGLPRGTVGLLVGQGAVGKTMLALEVAAGLALGRDLTFSAHSGRSNFLCPVTKTPRRVVLLLGEDSYAQIHNRVFDMASVFSLSQRDTDLLDVNLQLLALDGCDLRVVSLGDSKRPEAGPFQATVDRLGRWADLVVIDPLVRLHDSDENDNSAAAALMLALTGIAKKRDCALILLHHVPKAATTGKGDWRSARGAAAYSTSARWQVLVSPADDGSGNASPHEIHLALVKHNYCAPWPRFGLERKHAGVLIYTPTSQPSDAMSGGQVRGASQQVQPRPSPSALGKGWPPPYVDDDDRDS